MKLFNQFMFILVLILGYNVYLQSNNNLFEKDNNILNKKIDSLVMVSAEKDSLISQHEHKQGIIKDFIKEVFTHKFYTTRLTGYHPVPEQTDSTPDVTADGTKFDINRAGEYRYVALSRDLLSHFNRRGADIHFGDYIIIKGTPNGQYDGIYQVRDTMNKRHTEWIDILLTPGQQSFYYKKVLVQKITNSDHLEILREVYNQFPDKEPLDMVEPEV